MGREGRDSLGARIQAFAGRKKTRGWMRSLLGEMDYDFSQFTLEEFARWLEERRGREIVFVPYHFERPDVSGAWHVDGLPPRRQ